MTVVVIVIVVSIAANVTVPEAYVTVVKEELEEIRRFG